MSMSNFFYFIFFVVGGVMLPPTTMPTRALHPFLVENSRLGLGDANPDSFALGHKLLQDKLKVPNR